MRAALVLVLIVLAASLGSVPPVLAVEGPSEDRVLPVEQYTTEKARHLAESHRQALEALNADVYHCLPWLETQKHSIGFFRPKNFSQDDRYLSIRVFIEQDPSPAFARLTMEERASAMFSRYVDTLLRRMNRDTTLATDPALDGFTIILEWEKQIALAAGSNPIHETIAIFLPKAPALDYLGGRLPVGDLAERARVLGWDGETPLGMLKVASWDDRFVTTYHVANYQVAAGVTCR